MIHPITAQPETILLEQPAQMPDMPSSPPLKDCSILLLAGGRGQRMGGQDKGWVYWRGQALIEHVQAVARPMTDDLIISCNRNHDRYRPLADQLVSDPQEDFPGPFTGILEALNVARHAWLIVLPCDAPRVDRLLLEQLYQAAGSRPVIVRQGDYWQPLFCLVPTALLPFLQKQWDAGQRSPLQALLPQNPVALELAQNDPRTANFNEPAMLTPSLFS